MRNRVDTDRAPTTVGPVPAGTRFLLPTPMEPLGRWRKPVHVVRVRLRDWVRDGTSWLQPTTRPHPDAGWSLVLCALVGTVAMAPPTYGAPATPTWAWPGTIRRTPRPRLGGVDPSRRTGGRDGLSRGLRQPVRTGTQCGRAVGRDGRCGRRTGRVPGLEPGLARPLSIVEVDQSWSVPVATSASSGGWRARAPFRLQTTWECGDTDANVTAGADDALITRSTVS